MISHHSPNGIGLRIHSLVMITAMTLMMTTIINTTSYDFVMGHSPYHSSLIRKDSSIKSTIRVTNKINLFSIRGGEETQQEKDDLCTNVNTTLTSANKNDSTDKEVDLDDDNNNAITTTAVITNISSDQEANQNDSEEKIDDEQQQQQSQTQKEGLNIENENILTDDKSEDNSDEEKEDKTILYEDNDDEEKDKAVDLESNGESLSEEEEEENEETINGKLENVRVQSSDLRVLAKQYHDEGNFLEAATTFREAAAQLEDGINQSTRSVQQISSGTIEQLKNVMMDESATCYLHEALCYLKQKEYAKCIKSCSHVLQDGVEVIVPSSDHDEEDSDYSIDDDEEEEADKTKTAAAVVQIITTQKEDTTHTASQPQQVSAAVRARAHHRRAKARLALGDTSGALDDSRSAAYLGDHNAVALYGRLMRETGQAGGDNNDFASMFANTNGSDSKNDLSQLFSSSLGSLSSNSNNPFLKSGSNGGGSSALLKSLLSKSSPNGSSKDADINNPMSPFGALGGLGSVLGGNSEGGGGIDSLAKSMLSSLTKRIEEEDTQKMICKYLNRADVNQLTSLTSMAGIPMSEGTATKLCKFANGVTPKGINKCVKITKRMIHVGKILRKIFNVINKYKHLIVYLVLLSWVKSAMLRPVVVKPKK